MLLRYKIQDIVESLPKTIDINGCWIPDRVPDTNKYVRITIDGNRLLLSRLIIYLYNDVDYYDNNTLALHTCNNPTCFNRDHIRPGTYSDNLLDTVKAGNHRNSSKENCPRCGGFYSRYKVRLNKKVSWSRRCRNCKNKRRNELRRLRNES